METNPLGYIQGIGIVFKQSGKEIIFRDCPYCEKEGASNGSRFSHFYMNSETGTFLCHKCQEKGNLNKFRRDRGDWNPTMRPDEKTYVRPLVNDKYFQDTDTFFIWYKKHRGINPDILLKYKVGRDTEKKTFVYHYYDEKGVLFNRKYRTVDKKQWIEKDAEPGYYGLQFIDFTRDNLYVCEGEDDCHALIQMGLDNVVSVPLGAGNYTPAMDKINQRFKEIYLLFDNDAAGQDGARKFANKVSMAKCRNVLLPFKDARECLMNGMQEIELLKLLSTAEPFRVDNIVRAVDVIDKLVSEFSNPVNRMGVQIEINGFNKIVGGIRPAEMSILIGHTGKGKTTFAANMATWAMNAGLNVLYFPFENGMSVIVKKLIATRTGQKLFGWDEERRQYINLVTDEYYRKEIASLSEKNNLWFLSDSAVTINNGYYSTEEIGRVIEYSVKFNDTNLIIIDHLHYFLQTKHGEDERIVIEKTVRMIRQWAVKYNCHILLLCHPAKTKDEKDQPSRLGLYAPKGSSAIVQESDNYWIIEQEDMAEIDVRKTRLRIEKNRSLGHTGVITFNVSENLNRYTEANTSI